MAYRRNEFAGVRFPGQVEVVILKFGEELVKLYEGLVEMFADIRFTADVFIFFAKTESCANRLINI